MRIPEEKIKRLGKEAEKRLQDSIVSCEVQGAGRFCPKCGSMKLEHDNKYPRFTGKAIIMMTKCLTCGMLFDKPKISPDPYVVFKSKSGKVLGYRLEREDIMDKG